MKKKIFFLLINMVLVDAAPMTDIPFDYNDYHLEQHRWPQFLVSFYEGMKETFSEIAAQLSQIPESFYSLIVQNPHSNEQATVRITHNDDICQKEQDFLALRAPIVRANLEKLFNIKLEDNQTPRIGFVFSGGGFRAMLSTLGFLSGARDIGLLDCATYCVGLSGSTWALAPWVASKKPLHDFTQQLCKRLCHGIDHINEPLELGEILQIFTAKLLSRQFFSSMDIYGNVIANTLLKDFVSRPMLTTLTESHGHVQDGSLPLPIYTAIQLYQDPYEWMEVTPFEIGSSFLKSYIPTWAYGRKFKKGISVDYAPEQTLGYFMGIFGSAFEVSLTEIVSKSTINLSCLGHQLPTVLATALKKAIDLIQSSIGELRLFPSLLFNFTYKCEESPIKNETTIGLIDAGIDFNIPVAPMLRSNRNIDIIIIYDASANIHGAPELLKAKDYAQKKGLKFPPIDLETVGKEFMSIFKDENDPETPIVIYFPRLKNPSYSTTFDPDLCIEHQYCNTFNFVYSPEEAEILTNFAAFGIKKYQNIVKDTILDVLVQRYNVSDQQLQPKEALEITGIA